MSSINESINAATHHPDRRWFELAINVHAEAVEPVSELLARYGFNEGVAIDEPYLQDDDGDNLKIDVTRPFTIRTYIADSDYDETKVDEIRQALWHLGQIQPVSELRVSSIAEEDWANAWKDHFIVHRIGERVVIRPPWLEYEAEGDEVVVELDPGMAFGTGLHPSTRLSMLGVEHVVADGNTVLDVGTGSGILAIAALKLGASQVDAVDVETVAVRATEENAERNGVTSRLNVRLGSVGTGEPYQGTYDVVIANIIARILIDLADGIAGGCRPGGKIILAGIIEGREPDVVAAFADRNCRVIDRRQLEDWVSLILERSA